MQSIICAYSHNLVKSLISNFHISNAMLCVSAFRNLFILIKSNSFLAPTSVEWPVTLSIIGSSNVEFPYKTFNYLVRLLFNGVKLGLSINKSFPFLKNFRYFLFVLSIVLFAIKFFIGHQFFSYRSDELNL